MEGIQQKSHLDNKDFCLGVRSWSSVSVSKFAILLSSVFLIVGFTGNAKVNSGLNTMINGILDAGDDLVSKANRIGNKLEKLDYTMDAGEAIGNLVLSANDVLDQGRSVQTSINGYNSMR
jgi:uncharacterized protein YoxC